MRFPADREPLAMAQRRRSLSSGIESTNERTVDATRETVLVYKLVQSLFDSLLSPTLNVLLEEHRRAVHVLLETLRSRFVQIRALHRGGGELGNSVSTSSITTYKIFEHCGTMLEKYTKYICYIFGDDLDVIRCITSFTSAEAFDRNTVLYEVPLQRTNGGVFGFGNSSYRIESPLEDSLYRILDRMHKLDFYDSIVDQLRKYKASIRKCIGMLDRAASLDVNTDNVNGFLQDVTRDFAKIARQFVFLYLVNLNDDQVKNMFTSFRTALGQFETEVINLLHNFRDSAQHSLLEEESQQKRSRLG